ncbi:MAG: hypothetical protein HUU49_03015 [Candidatus Buchananbacteria bacterium]|nr:hypothetical protein [Candidatus Buchananbacteria bacterium]
MPWGHSEDKRPQLCFECKTPMQGTKEQFVNGHGFGSTSGNQLLPICINPGCNQGKKNLAESR